MKRPTIIDIARQVGVSKAAVSYALNGRAGVSAATRERILDVAAQLGWDAAGPARTPAADRTGTIGLVLARPPQQIRAEPSVVHWMAGLEAALAEYGLSLHLALPPDAVFEEVAHDDLDGIGPTVTLRLSLIHI